MVCMKHKKRLVCLLLALLTLFSLTAPAATAASSSSKVSVTLSNSASTGKIVLKWNSVSKAKKYAVYRAKSKSGSYSKLTTTTKLTYTDSKATAGEKYYYKVKALDSSGKVLKTSSVVNRVCDCARPSVTASNKADNGKVTLSWGKISGASKYEVYRSTSKSGTYSKCVTTAATSCTNTSTEAGKTYYYKVKAICSKTTSGNSAYSTVVSRTCDCAKPVISVSNKTDNGRIVLTWKAVNGAVSYDLYRSSTKDGTYSKLTTLDKSKLSYSDNSGNPGTTYYYKMKAVASNSAANSEYSTIKNGTCRLPMVTNAQVDYSDDGKVVFIWDKVEGATGYKIARANAKAADNEDGYEVTGEYSVIAEFTTPSYTDKTAKTGQYYCYKIYATMSGKSAAESAPLVGPAFALYPKVKNLTYECKDNKNIIKWTKVDGVDAYVVLRGTSQELEQMEAVGAVRQPLIKNECEFDEAAVHGVYYCIIGAEDAGGGNAIPTVPVFIYVK